MWGVEVSLLGGIKRERPIAGLEPGFGWFAGFPFDLKGVQTPKPLVPNL